MAEKVNMFGSNHDVLGSSDSNLILRTKGKVKIQYGRKFIDLIEDGKIVGENSKFIYHTDTVGTKDGIYVVGEGDDTKVVLVVGDLQITLLGEIGTTYVSFMAPQETTSSQKEQALLNIGFIYDSLEDVDSSAVENGIIYITGSKKLYTIVSGAVSEYNIDIPNPYTKQFVISKNDTSTGAIVINGESVTNSLAFNLFYLYSSNSDGYILATNRIFMIIAGNQVASIESMALTSNVPIKANTILSISANSNTGFRLYISNGASTLEVDNLVVRQSTDIANDNDLYPILWTSEYINVILSIDVITIDEEEEDQYLILLKYPTTVLVGGCGYFYLSVPDELNIIADDIYVLLIKVPLIVIEKDDDDLLHVIIDLDNMTDDEKDIVNTIGVVDYAVGAKFFVISADGEETSLLRTSYKGVDYITASDIAEELNLQSIDVRLGNIDELELTYDDNGNAVQFEGNGIYAKQALFDKAMYASGNDIPSDDRSSRLATTQWVMDRINEAINR